MGKTEELLAEANCEICKQKEADVLLNIGADIGYHIGNYGKGRYEKFKVKPICMAVISIYLCSKCEEKLKRGKYVHMNVLPELKKLIKKDLIKQAIIEGLK